MATFSEKVVDEFRRCVTETYELDDEVVGSLCNFVGAAIKTVGVPTGRGRTRRATTTKRKKSGYNVFVRNMMSSDADIMKLDHRQKMAAIGARWKGLSEEERTEFNDLAKEENENENETAATTEATTEATTTEETSA